MLMPLSKGLISLGTFFFLVPFAVDYEDEEDKFYLQNLPLKTALNVCLLSLLIITLFAIPLRAEYTDDKARNHYQNGLDYIEKGYTDLALKEVEEAVRLEPEVIEGRRYLAVAYTRRFDLTKAIGEYEAIFETHPEVSKVPAINVRWLKENEKMFSKLEEELKRLSETKPRDPSIRILLGWLYGADGRLREAHKELLLAYEEAPLLNEFTMEGEERVISTLWLELITALQSGSRLAKTELDLLLYTLKGNESRPFKTGYAPRGDF
jgi:tetratricopeptide (TPR) repeat protein